MKEPYQQSRVNKEIHVVTLVDNHNRDCFTDSALTINAAKNIGAKAIREKHCKSFRIDSFKVKVMGYGITWLEYVRV